MKRKQPGPADRSWRSLRKALGEDPGALGVEPVQSTFGAYLLANPSVTRHSYEPKVYEHYADVPYFRPDGWWQFQVSPWCLINGAGAAGEKAAIEFSEVESWPVAYHGTSCDKLRSILSVGLRKPGEAPLAVAAHGKAGAGPNGSVYLSPSLWYASHPVYSQLKQIGEERWAQAVLKLRARPGSYRVQRGTMGNKHWAPGLKMDPNFRGHHGLEWLFDCSTLQRCDYVIVAVMLREVGARADRETFGPCPPLTSSDEGPEYRWTRVLRGRLDEGGFGIDDTESDTYMDTDDRNPDWDSTGEKSCGCTETCDCGAERDEPSTCDCTEDDCCLDHGDGLRDARRIGTVETSGRDAGKLDVPGAFAAEYRLSLSTTLALASGAWSASTVARLGRKMAKQVTACMVRGQGTRAHEDAMSNYGAVLEAMRAHACDSSAPLGKAELLEWHGLCMRGLHAEAGVLRTCSVRCGDYPRLPGELVPRAVDEYLVGAERVMGRNDLSGSAKASWCFSHLCRVHPFRDGNGRISRLIVVWALARHGLPWAFCLVPLCTDAASRHAYIAAIKAGHAGEGRTGADTRPFTSHICTSLLAALHRCKGLPPNFEYAAASFDLSSHLRDPLVEDTEDTETA